MKRKKKSFKREEKQSIVKEWKMNMICYIHVPGLRNEHHCYSYKQKLIKMKGGMQKYHKIILFQRINYPHAVCI